MKLKRRVPSQYKRIKTIEQWDIEKLRKEYCFLYECYLSQNKKIARLQRRYHILKLYKYCSKCPEKPTEIEMRGI